ncbi:hypothetical protein LTT66_12155 [Nocardia gipuzkoensis]|uniref:hypothetical protein n=1 Tax=Nocardia TaxID=1817 RepID=UPI00031BE4D4|nr:MULTISPECIES: hypothetical protein [Nocardia]UGT70853.1 hypothetical protein LTT66_12155 [Nocardia gipuzkoensis]
MPLRTALTTLFYSLTALFLYEAITSLARRRTAAATHDVLTHYGTDHHDTTPGVPHN